MPPKRKGAAASKVAAKKLKKEATANTASEEVKEVEAKLVPSGAPVKHYIGAQQLLQESYQLALQILKSGYRPNYIVGVWRGGTPIGISVQEYLEFFGVTTDHIAIRTSSYYGIGQQSKTVRVHGLGYIIEKVNADDRLLIVDDVFDSGLSLQAAVDAIKSRARKNSPDIRIATVYYKPQNNKSNMIPNYYVHTSDKWLVFPHECCDLTEEELTLGKPEILPYILEGKEFQKSLPSEPKKERLRDSHGRRRSARSPTYDQPDF